ncbi:NFX1-type zinc finger-containing protein 1 [Oopsacas minuta]|uniref:NFX1-type zinc finger-containing protein 1 n=1 Tax=Oopsacas minuta TaxID=111878 RepID=A0AAV7JRT3_9METZ|nr:NFX1-type zinc finger-containing protein 1 [Oopsacas minuta]
MAEKSFREWLHSAPELSTNPPRRGGRRSRYERDRKQQEVVPGYGDYLKECNKLSRNEDPSLLINFMTEQKSDLEKLINSAKLQMSDIRNLVEIFTHSHFTNETPQTVHKINVIYGKLPNTPLFKSKYNILKFIRNNFEDMKNRISRQDLKICITSINWTVQLLRTLLNKYHNEYKNLSNCIVLLNDEVAASEEFGPQDKEAVVELFTLLTKVEAALRDVEQVKSKVEDESESDDQEDVKDYGRPFRCIPIFPTYQEIKTDSNVHLRALIKEGDYADLETYLDIHFKLLREDMVYPLKIAIRHLMDLDINFGTELYTYDNVKLQSITTDHKHGMIYTISFNPYGIKDMMNFDWGNSSRLKYGNLVCISQKNAKGYPTFENPLWAVVTHSDEEKVKSTRIVSIKFESGFEHNFKFDTDYFMVESREVYFEAYFHVLTCLQEINEDFKMPFEEILLGKTLNCDPPKYIDEETMLEFGDLLPEHSNRVKVLCDWPPTNKLNESQFSAVKLAFTKRLALIQGPPGTGKTTVGLEIVKILLRTRKRELNARHYDKLLDESICKRPILVITHSNHALDQFLELIMEVEENVIRIGSRSESEKVKTKTLFEMKKFAFDKKSKITDELRKYKKEYWEVKQELEARTRVIEAYASELKNATNILQLTPDQLKNVLSPQHYKSLLSDKPSYLPSPDDIVELWLSQLGTPLIPEKPVAKNIPESENPFSLVAGKDLTIPDEVNITDKYQTLERRIDYLDLRSEIKQSDKTIEPIIAATKVVKLPKKYGIDDEDMYDYYDDELEYNTNPVYADEGVLDQKDKEALNEAAIKFKEAVNTIDTSTKVPEEVLNEENIWKLSHTNRVLLSKYWLERYVNTLGLVLKSYADQYFARAKESQAISNQVDLYYLKTAALIGMTTTGAAKNAKLIKRLEPRVIVVEEAAEVLEAHILTSLSEHVEHLIMIGDHQQLRPSNAVYHLAQLYNINMSLFERLIDNKVAHITLDCQHRMRPEIANNMRLIYPNLTDYEKVKDFKPVSGVTKNTFFISHDVFEDELCEGSFSRTNIYEAKFVVQLALYLLKQGYSEEEITILTFYNGQRALLKDLMEKEDEDIDVKIRTIDKYQGEENKIIILSVVRGNEECYIGHCKVDNRVCVAFSRAREGFYIIGNEECLRVASENTAHDLWRRILHRFSEIESLGYALPLCCDRHKETVTLVSTSEDFKNIKHGGCDLLCHLPLPCSHLCTKLCHPGTHDASECQLLCTRTLPCSHPCPGKCGEDCASVFCTFILDKQAPCGHPVRIACGLDIDELDDACNHKCNTTLLCGHNCSGYCGMCYGGNHNACPKLCNRTLICGHKCLYTCHLPADCPPCTEPCSRECFHSKCTLLCGDLCKRCPNNIPSKCLHSLPVKCFESSNMPHCTRKCKLTLQCKHSCIGLCGEPCPTVCRVCNPGQKCFEVYFGEEKEQNSTFITLPDCGDIFEVSGLDNNLKTLTDNSIIHIPSCPRDECSLRISTSLRYHDIVISSQANIDKIKNQTTLESKQILLDKCSSLNTLLTKSVYCAIFQSLHRFQNAIRSSDCTTLYNISEIINILTNMYTDGYSAELWADNSPLNRFIQCEHFKYFYDEKIQYTPKQEQMNMVHLKQIYRQCPLYIMFKTTAPGSLSLKDKKSFLDLKPKFDKIEHCSEEDTETTLQICENFLYKVRGKYKQSIPICHYDTGYRRKIPCYTTEWNKCKHGHYYETTQGIKPGCPSCKMKVNSDDLWED